MLAAFISTVDSYILTWSTVIVNDIICPLVPRKVSERAHLWLLRMMVAAIAVFIFVFGIAYKPAQSLLDYIFLTGTMMLGAGILMIGAKAGKPNICCRMIQIKYIAPKEPALNKLYPASPILVLIVS